MLKKITMVSAMFCMAIFANHSISVTIPEIKHQEGIIRAILFDNEMSFNEKENPYSKMPLSVTNKKMTFQFDNVEPGVYAIQLFQDLNNNGEMDKKYFKPIEPYGMSNNPVLKGKPKFSDLAFESETTTNIVIELQNQN